MATPLYKKLGLKPAMKCQLLNEPDNYKDLIPEIFDEIVFGSKNDLDFIHIFCRNSADLEYYVPSAKNKLLKTGMMWVSWPKGASGLKTDIDRELIREYILGLGLVDVKVVSVDDTWSGLKFVYRLKDR